MSTLASSTPDDLSDIIATLTGWHDADAGRDREQQGLRIAKTAQEAGEALAAWFGVVGNNPRKGVTHTATDVADELADTVVCALIAIASMDLDPRSVLTACLRKNLQRVDQHPHHLPGVTNVGDAWHLGVAAPTSPASDARQAHNSRRLIIGSVMWRYGRLPVDGDRFVIVDLPDGPGEVNSVLLDAASWVRSTATIVEVGTGEVGQGCLSRFPFPDQVPSAELTALLPGVGSLAPLFVTVGTDAAMSLFVQTRSGPCDALFVWAGEYRPAPDEAVAADPVTLVRAAVESAEHHGRFLNNHQHYYRNFWPGIELEHKFTLDPGVDVYAVAVAFRNAVGRDELGGFEWEYGDIFQQWDFPNHMFEVTEPPEEAGYISFIPDSAGTHVMKRKWFTTDQVERRERKWLGVVVNDSFAAYLHDNLDVAATYVGAFRRTRFDVSCESTRTGNIYSIMVDRCQLIDHQGPDLCQVEVEYLYSRTVRDSARDQVTADLDHLVAAVTTLLGRWGVPFEHGPLSKLTYLRQARTAATAVPR